MHLDDRRAFLCVAATVGGDESTGQVAHQVVVVPDLGFLDRDAVLELEAPEPGVTSAGDVHGCESPELGGTDAEARGL